MTLPRFILTLSCWLLMAIAILAYGALSNLIGEAIFGTFEASVRALASAAIVFAVAYFFARHTAGRDWVRPALLAMVVWLVVTAPFAVFVLHVVMALPLDTVMGRFQFWQGHNLGIVMLSQAVAPFVCGALLNRRTEAQTDSP